MQMTTYERQKTIENIVTFITQQTYTCSKQQLQPKPLGLVFKGKETHCRVELCNTTDQSI